MTAPPPHTHRPPSAKQLRYLSDLALRTGESFTYPRTAAEASREIDRLREAERTPALDRRRDLRALQRDMAERRDDASAVDPEVELEGYGSDCRWSTFVEDETEEEAKERAAAERLPRRSATTTHRNPGALGQTAVMEVVEVGRLPWPHHPSKCHFWAQLEAAVPPELRDVDSEAVQSILEGATRSLPTGEVTRCRYRRPDWRRAAAAAIDFWAATGSDDCFEAGDWFTANAAFGEEELWAAVSFFREPIWLNGPLLGNGQHRVCAMKLAGVSCCLIEP